MAYLVAGPGRDVTGKLISTLWDPWSEFHRTGTIFAAAMSLHCAALFQSIASSCGETHALGDSGLRLIGQKRAAALQALGHEIVAVSDVAQERAATLARVTSAQIAHDWQTVTERPDVDVIVVATSHEWLSPIAVACLDHGKHVLVEKPAGRNLAEVGAIAAAATALRVWSRSATIIASTRRCARLARSLIPVL